MRKNFLAVALTFALATALCPKFSTAQAAAGPAEWSYEEMIAPQYEDADCFADNGLALVKMNGKYGFINTRGEAVIPCQYDLAYGFHDGYAVVGQRLFVDGDHAIYEAGIIDETGASIQLPVPEDVDEYTNYRLLIVSLQGEEAGAAAYVCDGYIAMNLCPNIEDSWWYYDQLYHISNGVARMVELPPWPEKFEGDYWTPDYFPYPATEGTIWTYLAGIEAVPYCYDLNTEQYFAGPEEIDSFDARPFHQGLAPVLNRTSGCWGFIDRQGQWVIEPVYEDFLVTNVKTDYQVFGSNGLASVKKNGKLGAIDKQGNTVIPFQYDRLDICIDPDLPIPFGIDGTYGYLSSAGEVVIPAQFAAATKFHQDGWAIVAQTNDFQNAWIIDQNGQRILEGQIDVDALTEFQPDKEWFIIEKDGKFGYGRIVHTGVLHSGTFGAHNELSFAYQSDGAISFTGDIPQGETVLVACYDDAGRFTGVKCVDRQTLEAQVGTDAAKLKLFWLGGNQAPRCGAQEVALTP